ncbi:MAG: tRNA (adenosine(37)-N6)-threonylcarbamoyltransferase complex ATPase subunit type 1 TsaE [Acidimicrobiia bacterium]|nr:tRNA (adenosine(37)-N6)-threonylcarbamoyltransferase complex ATPase subunit type 1 TsaE [Acidimicrobiia bacterium]MDH5237480.1 tRNA (adenosine(37)-N6)-threonylcarbamoyltransferase complex ATPase subunit type 1 TsaE [Acidimicrobiia bacterium]
MLIVTTASVEQTRAVAAAVCALCEPGDLVLLVGELGAGKTAFAQGFGRALGVRETITSPTFTLARQYDGRLRLHHLDVYRLEQIGETLDLDLPELLDGDTVTLIEWGDAIVPVLPPDYLEICLTFGDGDDDRVMELRPVGPRWGRREAALERALGSVSESDPSC